MVISVNIFSQQKDFTSTLNPDKYTSLELTGGVNTLGESRPILGMVWKFPTSDYFTFSVNCQYTFRTMVNTYKYEYEIPSGFIGTFGFKIYLK